MFQEATTSPAAFGTGTTADSATIRVLIVEHDELQAAALADALEADLRSSFAVTTAHSHSDCLLALGQAPYDVVLLNPQLPDLAGLDAVVSIVAAFPDTRICVMTGEDEPGFGTPLLQAGAEDYILKAHIHTPLLGPFLRTKVQRFHLLANYRADKQAESRSREMRSLDAMSDRPNTRISSGLYGGQSLRESARAEFDRLAETYERLLDQAIETRVFKSESGSPSPEPLIGFAHALGKLEAGPRDVVEIHTAAVRSMTAKAGAGRSRIILEEGRILVLGLMGHLVTHYRNYNLGHQTLIGR